MTTPMFTSGRVFGGYLGNGTSTCVKVQKMVCSALNYVSDLASGNARVYAGCKFS